MQRVSRSGSRRSPALLLALLAGLVLPSPRTAAAQVLERIGRAAAHEAEAEAQRQTRRAVRTAIRCAIGDQVCQDQARREGREVILVDAQGNPVGGSAAWSLSFGDDRWEGDTGRVIDDDVLLALHLTDEDDVSLWLFLADDDDGERGAAAVVLATEDGDRCRYPHAGSAPFVVRLDRVESDAVSGAYQGTVACDGETAPVRASGTFRVAR